MVNQYKVSVLVPVFGVEEHIEKCARSLFEQSYGNIEFIFINDCTKDNSIGILNRVILDYPHRQNQIRIINHSKNKGLASARNTAVLNATGSFVCHVDSDDWIEVDYIQKLVDCQLSSRADIVRSNDKSVFSNSIKTRNNTYSCQHEVAVCAVINREIRHTIWGLLIRKSLYTNHNILAIDGCNMGEDYQVVPQLYYWSKIIAYSEVSYYYNKSNEMSYTVQIKESTLRQSLKSAESVADFFKDKEDIFQKCSTRAICHSYYSLLSQSFKGNYLNLIKELQNKINKLPRWAKKDVAIPYKLLTLNLPHSLVRFFWLKITLVSR